MDAVDAVDAVELLESLGGMARRRQLRKAGLSRRRLRAAVASAAVRQLTPDLYASTNPGRDDLLRAAVVRLDGVASHESAALLLGIELARTPITPHVTVGRNRGGAAHEGVEVHRSHVADAELEMRGTTPLTGAVRTVLDLCRSLPLAEAVAAADSALRKKLLSVDDLEKALRELPAGRGRGRVAAVTALIDPKSGSVLESLCRVLLAEAGLPKPEPQWVVRQQGRWIGRVDFAWPGQRLIVETDGFAFHKDRRSYRKDRRRNNALQLAGWTVLRFSWEDVVHDPEYVVASVRAALAACAAA